MLLDDKPFRSICIYLSCLPSKRTADFSFKFFGFVDLITNKLGTNKLGAVVVALLGCAFNRAFSVLVTVRPVESTTVAVVQCTAVIETTALLIFAIPIISPKAVKKRRRDIFYTCICAVGELLNLVKLTRFVEIIMLINALCVGPHKIEPVPLSTTTSAGAFIIHAVASWAPSRWTACWAACRAACWTACCTACWTTCWLASWTRPPVGWLPGGFRCLLALTRAPVGWLLRKLLFLVLVLILILFLFLILFILLSLLFIIVTLFIDCNELTLVELVRDFIGHGSNHIIDIYFLTFFECSGITEL
mmetsp:Transcript_20429/g.37504  ORF Transcript_20429/g.37504 Transcript_20429/m.37504 type:complete len:304 (+) Transcript_20429:121-1032(+)